MDALRKIADARIRESIEHGELDDLPMRGRRIRLEDLSNVPEELRVGYMILRNAGVLPEEMQLQKDMTTLQRLIDCCIDDEEAAGLRRRMHETNLRYRILREKRLHGPAFQRYATKIRKRFRV